VRTETLGAHPELRTAIERLAGRISEGAMRQMNYDVDVSHRDVTVVAREFLDRLGVQSPTR
jgi:glycine betaine/choline ABC-type transport system substrate-binding protein